MVPSQHSALRGAFEWIVIVAIALAATFVIRTFVVEPFVVPTGSMESTIEIGDQILRVLQSAGVADEILADAGGQQLLGVHLPVGRRGRV